MSTATASPIRVGIVGAKAFTAGVLVEILLAHPNVQLAVLAGRDPEPVPFDQFFPELRGRLDKQACGNSIVPYLADSFAARCDAAFLCLPHQASAQTASELLARNVRVFDLSADFRFTDPAIYAAAYGHIHPFPELNAEAPYALAEMVGDKLRGVRLAAIPGCYTTSVLLPLIPLVKAGLIDLGTPIVADSKSGVSGAGRQANDTTHYCAANEAFSAYAIGNHRHRPELREKLTEAAGQPVSIVFTPHLVPMDRGILSTIYVRPGRAGVNAATLRTCLEEAYAGWPLVRVLPAGQRPNTKAVLRTGYIDIATFDDKETDVLIVVSALDNLVKGASGQAVQAFNLAHGLPDARGLLPGV